MKQLIQICCLLLSCMVQAQDSRELQAYSQFDFVTGDSIVYANRFEEDPLGEIPIGWSSDGSGQVITFNNRKWVKLLQRSAFITDNISRFGDHFSVEFDLYLDFNYGDAFYPSLSFGLLSSGTSKPNGFDVLSSMLEKDLVAVDLAVNIEHNSFTKLLSLNRGNDFVNTGNKTFRQLEDMLKKPIHVSMQVQKGRFRIWLNEHKLYDVSQAVPDGATLDQIFFRILDSTYPDDQIGIYVTDIKVAKGLPDTKSKLLKEGRFSTTGILFDINSPNIRIESYGVLRQIGGLMNSQPDMKLMIVGHTDSDGNDADNLRLSRQRSESVKQFLVKQFGIHADRIQTEGKGENQPVSDNKTKEGKAQNRRVEFIRQ